MRSHWPPRLTQRQCWVTRGRETCAMEADVLNGRRNQKTLPTAFCLQRPTGGGFGLFFLYIDKSKKIPLNAVWLSLARKSCIHNLQAVCDVIPHQAHRAPSRRVHFGSNYVSELLSHCALPQRAASSLRWPAQSAMATNASQLSSSARAVGATPIASQPSGVTQLARLFRSIFRR